jgi:hypothetical protein
MEGRRPVRLFHLFQQEHSMTIRRTLAAALAATAIAAPSASAIPADTPAAKPPAAQQQPVSQVLRSPGHPSEAGNVRPLPPLGAQAAQSDGLDWMTIGLGIAGTLLALGGIIALTSRRPVPRTRISV